MSGAATLQPAGPAAADTGAAHVRDEVCRLASRVAEASDRLRVALRQKERLSRLLDEVLESLQAGVVLLDASGRLVAANAAAGDIGAVADVPGGEGPRVAPFLLEAAGSSRETIVRPPHDPAATWIVRPGRVTLPEGGDGRLLLVQDATRLVTAEERSHRRSRLEMVGRMAAELAHEVRNPLGSLELFASVLVEDLGEGTESREIAEQLLLGVRTLSGTVTRFLSAARGGERTLARTDAATLVRESAEMLRPLAFSREIELQTVLPGSPCPADLDAEGVRQALLNLVGNALDATPAGGRVAIVLAATGDDLVLEVADSGPGVPREQAGRIFEPFFTTREEGTGLGLAVVERVALAHGGVVEVGDSDLGGAVFRVRLPRDAAGEPAAGAVHTGGRR